MDPTPVRLVVAVKLDRDASEDRPGGERLRGRPVRQAGDGIELGQRGGKGR